MLVSELLYYTLLYFSHVTVMWPPMMNYCITHCFTLVMWPSCDHQWWTTVLHIALLIDLHNLHSHHLGRKGCPIWPGSKFHNHSQPYDLPECWGVRFNIILHENSYLLIRGSTVVTCLSEVPLSTVVTCLSRSNQNKLQWHCHRLLCSSLKIKANYTSITPKKEDDVQLVIWSQGHRSKDCWKMNHLWHAQ